MRRGAVEVEDLLDVLYMYHYLDVYQFITWEKKKELELGM